MSNLNTTPDNVQVVAGVTATTPLYSTRVRDMFNTGKRTGEVNHQPSVTIPAMTLSLAEILDRFSKGIPPPVIQGAGYLGEDSLLGGRPLQSLDLVERQALKSMLQDAIQTAQKLQQQRQEEEERRRNIPPPLTEKDLPVS